MPASRRALPAPLRAGLVRRWAEPHRGYHGLRHLAEVLLRIDQLAAAAEHPDDVRLAAWYHDAVYDPARADNEERSALLAVEQLTGHGVAAEVVARVSRLVRLTAGHDPAPGDADGAVLCDADLGVLGAPGDRYADYVAGVRREYSHVPPSDFAAGRLAVLEALAAMPVLYRTTAARDRWEQRARANLAAEISSLRDVVAAGADPRR